MSIDTGHERIGEGRQRREIVRLTPAASPGQAGQLSISSPSRESKGRSRPREGAQKQARVMPRLPTWLRRLRYYGLALLFVASAVLLRWGLSDVLRPAPFLVFYLAWVGAAAFGGLGPGLLATVASWLCVELLFHFAPGHIGFDDPTSLGRLLVFLAGGLVVSIVGEGMRRARIHARRRGRELADLNAALWASEEKYRRIVETATEAIVMADANARIVFVNDRWSEIVGYSREEAGRMTLFDVVFPEDLAVAKQRWESRKQGRKENYEVRLRRKDGSTVWALISTVPTFGPEREFLGELIMAVDITQRKKAEETLRASEEKYRFLVENSKDVTWTMDLQGRWTFMSSNAENVAGYRADEFIGKTLWDFLAPECHDLAREKLRRRAQGEDLPPYEVMFVDKDGRRRPFEVRAAAILDSAGNIVGVQGVSRDITERKRAEAALRESEFHLAQAQQITHLGSWSWDFAEDRLFWSDETYRLYGLQPGELVPRHEDFLSFVHPEDRARVEQGVQEGLAHGGSCRLDFRIVQKGGQERYVHCETQVTLDREGRPVKAEGALQDITERKRAEQDLSESRDKYQALIETTADFIWEMDAEGTYTYCSPQMKDLWGYEPQDMIGKTPFDVMPPEDRKQAVENFRSLAKAPKSFAGLEASSYDNQGRLIAVEISGVPFFDADGRLLGYRGISRDITERKQAQEALAESRRRYRDLVEKVNDWVWEIDANGVYTYASPRAQELLGYAPEEIVGKTPFDLMPPAEAQRVWDAFKPTWLERKPLELLENTLVRKDGRLVTVETSGMPLLAEDGTFLGYSGIDRDVTARKQAEEALRASQSMLRSVMENVPQGVFWKDRHSTYLGCNPVFAQAVGLASVGDVVGKTDYDLPWSPEQTASFREYDRRIMENDAPEYHIVEQMRDANGKLAWVETNKVPLHDAQGQVIGILGTYEDITERKQAEEALRESEEKFRVLAETSPAAIIIYQEGKYVYVNPAAESLTGYRRDEILQQAPGDLVHPEYRQQARKLAVRRMRGEEVSVRYEAKILTKDGRERWMDNSSVSIIYGKKPAGLLVAFDITERKQAEEALQESRERLERAQGIAHLGSWELDLVSNRLTWSDEVYRIFGLPPQDFGATYEAFLDCVHPDDRAAVDAAYSRSLREGRDTYEIEHRVVRRSTGEIRIVHEKCEHIRDASGRIIRSLGMVHDITERKRAEEALQKSEEKFAKAFQSSPIAVAVTRLRDGHILDANEAMLKLLHFTPDEVIGHTTRDLDIWVDVNDRTQFTQMLSAAGSVRDLEYRLRTKEGAIVTVHLSAEVLEFGGEPCLLTTLVDVTERQRAVDALRQEKAFTDKLLNAPRDTVFLFEPATGQPIRWNHRFVEVSGYDDAEIARMKAPDDFYDEDDLKKVSGCLGRIFADGQGVVELSLITKQGVPIPFEYVATMVETEDGKTLLLSIGRDITERKRAEAALQASEEKYRFLVENSKDITWTIDLQGRWTFISSNVEKVTGYQADEVVGKTVWDFLAPECHDLVKEKLAQRRRGADVLPYEVLVVGRDGRRTPFELHTAPILDGHGRMVGVQGVSRDITERKKAAEALREWNAMLESKVAQRTQELQQRARQLQKLTLELTEAEERERKRLAEILHDDLQQVLTAAKFQVSLLNSRVRNDAESQEIVGQTKDLLVDAIAKSRSLSHELSTPALSQSDLGEAFEWLAEQMQKKYGLTVHLDLGERILLASEPLRVLLYKAAQESLFNVIKHAEVHEAKVRLRHRRGRLRLSISDQGRGFDPAQSDHALGFGLLSIRERVGYLGGRLKIRSAPGKGSMLLITVPDAEASP